MHPVDARSNRKYYAYATRRGTTTTGGAVFARRPWETAARAREPWAAASGGRGVHNIHGPHTKGSGGGGAKQ